MRTDRIIVTLLSARNVIHENASKQRVCDHYYALCSD